MSASHHDAFQNLVSQPEDKVASLDKTQQANIEHKTETFSSVYKKLTGQEVNFEFQKWLCKAVCGDTTSSLK